MRKMAAAEAALPYTACAQKTRRGSNDTEIASTRRSREGAASETAHSCAAILKDAQSLAAASKATCAETPPATAKSAATAAESVAAMAAAAMTSPSSSTSY
jgi:hypothetical protein